MANLKVPSLQHLARIWDNQPEKVQRKLIALAKHPPTFSYNPLYDAARDMLVYGVTHEQVEHGISRYIKRQDVKENFLSILPLLKDYLGNIVPDYVHSVTPRYYPISRDLTVPFTPPLVYGLDGVMHFPWFIFWRDNPLMKKRLSLFVSIVDDVMRQDPDLEEAKFQIIDLSAPTKKGNRTLKIYNASDIPRVSEIEKMRMLTTLAEGYRQAAIQLASIRNANEQPADGVDDSSGQQKFKL